MPYLELVDRTEIDGTRLELRKTKVETSDFEKTKGLPIWKYSLLVKTEEGQERFPFYGSVADYQEDRDPEIEEVFEMVLSDATSYIEAEDIDDFQRMFDFEKVSRCVRAWKECRETAEKLKRLGFTEEEIFDTADRLRE